MKPNKNQLLVINLLKNQVGFWENTNDIDSPTHICDIEQEVDGLKLDATGISEGEFTELTNKVIDLLALVRKIK